MGMAHRKVLRCISPCGHLVPPLLSGVYIFSDGLVLSMDSTMLRWPRGRRTPSCSTTSAASQWASTRPGRGASSPPQTVGTDRISGTGYLYLYCLSFVFVSAVNTEFQSPGGGGPDPGCGQEGLPGEQAEGLPEGVQEQEGGGLVDPQVVCALQEPRHRRGRLALHRPVLGRRFHSVAEDFLSSADPIFAEVNLDFLPMTCVGFLNLRGHIF